MKRHRMDGLWQFTVAHRDEIMAAVRTHAALSATALSIAACITIPLGVWCAHDRTAASYVIGIVNAARVVPSLAVLVLMLPLLGLGFAPALVALMLLACPPILVNTYVAFRDVDGS